MMAKSILIIIWELPQFIAGAFFYLFHKNRITGEGRKKNCKYYIVKNLGFSVSLANLIFLDEADFSRKGEKLLKHEFGHSLQSSFLGWFYFLIVGIPSAINSITIKSTKVFPENWADRLGGN